jgi:hypothetical protein
MDRQPTPAICPPSVRTLAGCPSALEGSLSMPGGVHIRSPAMPPGPSAPVGAGGWVGIGVQRQRSQRFIIAVVSIGHGRRKRRWGRSPPAAARTTHRPRAAGRSGAARCGAAGRSPIAQGFAHAETGAGARSDPSWGRRPGRPLIADRSLRHGGRTRPRQATVPRSCTPRTSCAAGRAPTRRLRGVGPRRGRRFASIGGPVHAPCGGAVSPRKGAARHDDEASCREAVEEGRSVARPPVRSSGAPPRVGTAARRPSLRDRLRRLAGRPGHPA